MFLRDVGIISGFCAVISKLNLSFRQEWEILFGQSLGRTVTINDLRNRAMLLIVWTDVVMLQYNCLITIV